MVFILVRLVQYVQETYNGAGVFVASILTAAYMGLVVGILVYAPRERL